MSAPAPTVARELELVGKVEMRIALAKDEKLESILKVYLPPLLLKLGSDYEAVRNKVCLVWECLRQMYHSSCVDRSSPHVNISKSGSQAISTSFRLSSIPGRVTNSHFTALLYLPWQLS
jgi:hypothetical protein